MTDTDSSPLQQEYSKKIVKYIPKSNSETDLIS